MKDGTYSGPQCDTADVGDEQPDVNDSLLMLTEHALEGMLIIGRDGKILYANSRAGIITGYSKNEIIGSCFADFIYPDERDAVMERFGRRLSGLDEPARYETVLIRKDDTPRTVEISAGLTLWRGKSAGGVIFHDITDHKDAQQKSKESERMLSSLVSNLPGMVYRCRNDRERTMLIASDGCEKLTGYTTDELTNHGVNYEELIHPEDRPRVRKIMHLAMGNRHPWRLEYRIITKTGSLKWVRDQGEGILNDYGSVSHMEGFIIDITDWRHAEDALRKLEERQNRAEQLAYVGEMAARLNHDIKNPLATVLAGLDLLARQIAGDEEKLAILDKTTAEVRNVSSLVSDLLSTARIDRFEPRPVLVNTMLEELAAGFMPLARRNGLEVENSSPADSVTITVDTKAFRRLMGNLIINAVDVLPRGGIIRVGHRLLSEGERDQLYPGFEGDVAAITVSDNGPGIPRDIIDHVFTPFFTTKKGGTGLGLAIAHDIVESHGGKLVVGSAPGRETSFTAHFPAGERPPCYLCFHEKKEECAGCNVSEYDICWLTRRFSGGAAQQEESRYCAQCPVFRRWSLTSYGPVEGIEVSKCKVPYFWWTMNRI